MTCTVLLVTLMMVSTVSFIYGTQKPIKNCTELSEVCGVLHKIENSKPRKKIWCNCHDLGDYYCNMEWQSNRPEVIFPSENEIIVNQLVHCTRRERPCKYGEIAAMMTNQIYHPFCKCPGYSLEMHEYFLRNEEPMWSFKCEQSTCATITSDCLGIFRYGAADVIIRSFCKCPEGRNCLPKRVNSEFVKLDNDTYVTYNCQ